MFNTFLLLSLSSSPFSAQRLFQPGLSLFLSFSSFSTEQPNSLSQPSPVHRGLLLPLLSAADSRGPPVILVLQPRASRTRNRVRFRRLRACRSSKFSAHARTLLSAYL